MVEEQRFWDNICVCVTPALQINAIKLQMTLLSGFTPGF